ncbi:galactose-6-phosphate isomerase subunit LacA [Bacillus smithii]|uniref:galactose-6-phosphate isomerase subunit LacA n=1 Tax=Bacillus smithii TaxID=1479 RepID=UPI0030C901B1
MQIVIGADSAGFELKEHLKKHLSAKGHKVIDKTPENDLDFFESTTRVAKAILANEADRGIAIDEYGAGSFMTACKYKGIICAEVSDEHSAKMTRDHNNASMITMGAGIVGKRLAGSIVDAFIKGEYSGGRHQIRVDMLNKMA